LTTYIPIGIININNTTIGGEKLDTRDIILENALELFYTKGYDSVGVQEIADNAGITKPTLYYYFGSKTGLLNEILKINGDEFIALIKETSVYQGDLPITLYRVAAAYLEYASKHRKFYFFMIALSYYAKENEAHKAIEPYINEVYQIILSIFESAAKELGNMNGRQQRFATGFVGTINYYLLYLSETSSSGEIEITNDQVFSLVHQFMHGIYS
jgi:AcrR family transcriptional regulator